MTLVISLSLSLTGAKQTNAESKKTELAWKTTDLVLFLHLHPFCRWERTTPKFYTEVEMRTLPTSHLSAQAPFPDSFRLVSVG